MQQRFYPEDAPVPSCLRTPTFVLRPLRTTDATLDHATYVASPDTIRVHSGGRWPTDNFTAADNLPLAAQHEQEHRARTNFTFVLLDRAETESLGCLYFRPLLPFLRRAEAPVEVLARTDARTAMVTFWIRQSHRNTELAELLVMAVKEWLVQDWLFSGFVFRVNGDEDRSLAALSAAGLRCKFVVGVADPPLCYSFYGMSD